MRLPAAVGSFRRQIVVLTACVTAFAMLLLTLVLQLVLADLSGNDVDRVLEERTDAVVGSVSSATTGDRLEVPDADLDIGVVVYDAEGRVVAGSAPAGDRSRFDDLAASDRVRSVSVDEASRIRATPFTTETGVDGVVVVAERLAPYEEAEHYALIVSLVTGALATAAAAAIAAWVTSRALRPVAELTSTAADWSEHDLSQRFDLGPPSNEITGLAAVLDTLLDKVATAIRSEQRLTSELAHELRTPLTTIQGTADLALMRHDLTPELREDLEQVTAASRRMAATITALLDLARSAASMSEASESSLADVVAEAVQSTPHHDVAITVEVADQRLGAPYASAVRALVPVLENAVRFAQTRVTVSASLVATGLVHVEVEDDGPGIHPPVGDDVFAPGTTSGTGSGGGLGLAIARRMARSVGGDVVVSSAANPTRFTVLLPRA